MINLSSNQNTNEKEVKDMRRNKKKGFTLIELIVVIAILGILAAVAIPRLSGFQDSAKKKADVADAKTIATAVATLLADQQVTLATGTGVTTTTINVADTPTSGSNEEKLNKYIQTVPKPKTTGAGANFTVVITNSTGDVKVYAGGTAATDNQCFPIPSSGSVYSN